MYIYIIYKKKKERCCVTMGIIISYIMAYKLLRNMEECVMGYACGEYSWLARTQSFLE